MANKQNNFDPADVVIFFARAKGGGPVVAESMRAFKEVFEQVSQPRLIKPVVKALPLDAKKEREDKTLWDSPEGDAAAAAEEVEAEAVDNEPTDPNRGSNGKRVRVPKGIPDLDFNSETPTFRDYVAEKKPKDQYEWYMLVASWMKHYKRVEEISLAHVVTARQYIGSEWSLPKDPGAVFRDGRRSNLGIFAKGSKDGLNVITKNGEDRVARMGKTG